MAELDDLERRVTEEIRRLLLRLSKQPGGDSLESTRDALKVAAEVRMQIVARMEAAKRQARALTKSAVDTQVNAHGAAAGGIRSALDAIVRGQAQEAAIALGHGSQTIGRAQRAALATGGSIADLVDDVAKELRVSFAKASASVELAAAGAQRTIDVEQIHAADQEGGDAMGVELVGPDDDKTRAWCADMMSRGPITLKVLSALKNDAGQSAEAFAGGYGCRHKWVAALLP
jgi:hypothetical protein